MPTYKNAKEHKYYALQDLAKKGTPEEKFKALYEEANHAVPKLHKITKEVARRYGGKIIVAKLKDSKVAWEKLSRGDSKKGVDEAEIAKLNDIVRATVQFKTFADLLKAQRYIDRTYDGIVYDRYKDGATENGYRDVKYVLKVAVDMPNRSTHHICELQLHTAQSSKAYKVFHPIYEVLRRMGKNGEARPISIPADETADLGEKLRATWSTMQLRQIGGQELVHCLYDIVAHFYTDKALMQPRNGKVDLSKEEVECLIDMGPIIHEAYHRNMMNAMVVVDGKLQPVVNGLASKGIHSNAKVLAQQKAQVEYMKGKQPVKHVI